VITDNNLTAHIENGKIIIPLIAKELIGNINQQLADNNIAVYEIATVKNDLETIFMNLINQQ